MEIKNTRIIFSYAKYGIIISVMFVIPVLTGCGPFIRTKAPVTSVNGQNVYLEDRTAIAVLTGIYGQMTSAFTGNGSSNISLRAALSADELTLFNGVTDGSLNAYYKNQLVSNASSSFGGELWPRLYGFIFICNSAIEGLSISSSLTPSVKQELLGEARFLRAFFYFYLVNLYGNVPLVVSTDPDINTAIIRSDKKIVYQQIVEDLKEAKKMLNGTYVNGNLVSYASNEERVRPTIWAATALLARVFLYMNEYSNSEAEASIVINQNILFDTVPLNSVFNKNSKEAIWQLQPVLTNRNTEDAFTFIIPTNGPSNISGTNGNPVYLSNQLLNAFEPGDKRRVVGNWVNNRIVGSTTYYYPYKYKVTSGAVSEYAMVLRLGEQYLVRAEARARQMKLVGANSAESDLNIIRKRASLLPTSAQGQENLIDAIMREKRVEFFSEWGHRWLDIKRADIVNLVMNLAVVEKGVIWQSYQQWYPLPFKDIQNGPNLSQNDGYIK